MEWCCSAENGRLNIMAPSIHPAVGFILLFELPLRRHQDPLGSRSKSSADYRLELC